MIETLKIYVPQALEILTLASDIAIGLFALFWIFAVSSGKRYRFRSLIYWLQKHYLLCGLVISLLATGGSLFYSTIMGFTPCSLCWWQRIFMYPQVILFALALGRKDFQIWKYAVWLSVIGGSIAAYHYALQMGAISSTLPCAAVGYSASCSELFFVAYGYITIPMMALTAFVLLIILAFCMRQRNDAIRYDA